MPSTFSLHDPRAVSDQHRRRAAVFAPAFQHRQAVHARKAEIEHDGDIILGVAKEPGVLAIAGALDHVARRR